jgi:large subunit ribosomal protein L17
MASSLFQHEIIETTDAKAKDLRSVAEKLITLAKRGDLHARRQAYRTVRDQSVLAKLFDEIGPRYSARPGGYTRVIKNRVRLGDCAPLSIIELVDRKSE